MSYNLQKNKWGYGIWFFFILRRSQLYLYFNRLHDTVCIMQSIFPLLGEWHCWWTRSPLGHMKQSSAIDFGWFVNSYFKNCIRNCNFVGLLRHPSCLQTILAICLTTHFKFLSYFIWKRITDKGSLPETCTWSTPYIPSDFEKVYPSQ